MSLVSIDMIDCVLYDMLCFLYHNDVLVGFFFLLVICVCSHHEAERHLCLCDDVSINKPVPVTTEYV